MIKIINLLCCLVLMAQITIAQQSNVKISGELKKWHKVTLSLTGEELSENDAENPFLDYRLNVTFKHNNKSYLVPGFYAADGKASETSATKGAVWQVRFTPDEVGEWSYEVSFRKGKAIAVNDDASAGKALSFDGAKGTFTITASDKTGRDLRAQGRLHVTDKGYLQFADSKKYFLKGGADSPESFLGYYDFDQTPPSHKYEPHSKDWKSGDPTWQNGKGKNMIGALNYLSSKGMNSVYFLTMNVQGDGKDVWPWIDVNERYRFDVSKLDQWEVVFDHMEKLGLMMHIVTQETENELLLDIGELGVQRKLYYRELIARFAHHLAITWNLGEENGPLFWTPKGQDDKDRKDMAKYIKTQDPYKNLVVLHTHANLEAQDLILEPLLGYQYLDGPSFQTRYINDIHHVTKKYIAASAKAGKRWIACQDEIGPADTGAKPDADDPEHNEIRHEVLWGNLMAGGAGVEWYFGYKYAHNDLLCEDWRSRDILWDQTRVALEFFQKYLPFQQMKSADDLTTNEHDYVFAENDHIYAIYLPKVEATSLNLIGLKSTFTVKWYNPRTGGELQNGTIKTIKGGSVVSIGLPPSTEKDWVALISNKKKVVSTAISAKTSVVFNALTDFIIDTSSKAVFYKDAARNALAINAAQINQREVFASAATVFKGVSGFYKGSLVGLTEIDGESEYQIKVNGTVVGSFKNSESKKDYLANNHVTDKIFIETNDIIEVLSKAVTNGKIPEKGGTAYARGRWVSLELNPIIETVVEAMKNEAPFSEKNGMLEVEAEDFYVKSNNGTKRDWYIRTKENTTGLANLEDHTETASKNSYIEALPDTRVTHDDPLIAGENFFPEAGKGGVVSYKIKVNSPGKYYVWVRAYSSGPEDNGLHVGIDGEWPESGERIQLCEGKNKWTWSSAQRVPENHCGVKNTIFLNIDKKGEHIISFSMREDGFELDKFLLTKDKDYNPNLK